MKVLHFILYEKLFPPKNGGMLRCWNIMEQVSRYYEVDVITLQNDIADRIKESRYALPLTTKFITPSQYKNNSSVGITSRVNKLRSAIKYRWHYRTVSSADSSLLNVIPVLRSIAGNHYDFVIFEHLESLRLYQKVKSLFPNAQIVLDAHNIDHVLLHNISDKRRVEKIKKTESSLHKNCDLVLATNNADAAILKTINRKEIKIAVVPNGIDIDFNSYQLPEFETNRKKIIFCGSLDYEPNQSGLLWFLNNMWQDIIKKHPGIVLLVVGRGQPGGSLLKLLKCTSNIEFVGEVDEVIPYYRKVQCAVVPLLHGSGTRLKILEAMSLGVPVISTSIGAQGINCNHGETILICNQPNEFIAMVDKLFEDDSAFRYISKNARELVTKEYSWNTIGNSLYQDLENLSKRGHSNSVRQCQA